MIKRSYDVAVDVTNMPYYGKVLKDGTYKSRPKDGTARFHSYVTAHLAGNEYNVPLNSARVKKGEKMDTVLLQMCQKIIRGRIRPSRILLDRWFFSVACMLVLARLGLQYIIGS